MNVENITQTDFIISITRMYEKYNKKEELLITDFRKIQLYDLYLSLESLLDNRRPEQKINFINNLYNRNKFLFKKTSTVYIILEIINKENLRIKKFKRLLVTDSIFLRKN